MNFLELFNDVVVSPIMLVTKVTNIKLKPASNSMQVTFTVPEEPTDAEKKELTDAILNIYPVDSVDATFNVLPQTKKVNPVLIGKPLTGDVEIEKICNLDQYYGKAVIEGLVISTEERETKRGKILFKFQVTDKTSSITCKLHMTKPVAEKISSQIKTGKYLRVMGEASYDKYDNEVGIFADAVTMIDEPLIIDDAEEKRVELHLHTKMSALDSVIEVEDAVKRAAQWGHKAIAITDHGVVQAYPDALDAGKKNGVKIIYGAECYLVDDETKIVKGCKNSGLDESFIALDIETTGLSPLTSSIIEIGAVKIEKGQITDTYSQLIDPGFQISSFTTDLTGITNDMLLGMPDIKTALPEFLDFAGDLPIIAHNADFDCGFIKYNCDKLGLTFSNTSIDTLELCKSTLPDLKKFKLDIVAKYFKINMGSHHRAFDDARTCGMIFIKSKETLAKLGVENIQQINAKFVHSDYTKANTYHIVLLVKNQTGMKNLYRIISESHLNYFYKRPRVPKRILSQYREGLIVGSACEAGELFRSVVDGKCHDELRNIAEFYDYLEIQPIGNNRFMLEDGTVDSVEQLQDFNRIIIDLAKEMNKPYVATCDAHFLDPDDKIFRAIIQAGQKYKDADNQAPLYFRNTTDMLKEFEYLDEETAYNAVVKNTNLIADMIEDDLQPIPKKTYAPKIDGAEDDVRNISYKTAHEIYGEDIPQFVLDRMEKELNSIINNGFSVMYVIAQKLVWKSLEDGYLVGSRGSVGSSFIAFLMKITEVNSLCPHYVCPNCKHNEFITDGKYACGVDMPDKDCPVCGTKMNKDGFDIPFETFLGFHGEKDPDIDLNFSGEYQAKAHKYLENFFGSDHVFKAGTISTLADKTAYGYVVNYLSERNIVATNAEKNRLTIGCTGVRKTTGQHPGGMVVVPDDMDIYDFCPIHRPADKTDVDIITTHFDYSKMKGTLLKFDILGHDDPTVLRMLSDITGIDVQKIPLDDQDVMSLFSSNKMLKYKDELYDEEYNEIIGTNGLPEFGTGFTKQMLLDTLPTTFGELIRISGLSHGTDVWLNNAQDLVRNKIATLKEVICTRDDIMVNLMYMGMDAQDAFDIMEFTRKGKFAQHQEYIPRMKASKVPDWYIDSCLKIKYMFPKAHAAAYVMMAFRIAWFKVHKPLAFYMTYFTVRADLFDASIMTKGIERTRQEIKKLRDSTEKLSVKDSSVLTILEVCNEMYTRGFEFAKIDLYKSDAVKFLLDENEKILPPLSAMPGLGENAAKSIAEARVDGEFTSIEDLRMRSGVNKTAIEVLRQEGCLDGMQESAQITFF
ncbi:MAG: PolC-type DNA polymerase III [Clostridia bacterium]|nr:PolC-type DNA polymerase III [Clostridia bacterium]